MLHGMCALPEYECPVYRSGATAAGWLLCPPGPVACTGSGAMWTGTEPQLRSVIESSLQALDERQAGAGAGRRALVGYSLGASAALRIAYSGRSRFDALMLVNAGLDPDAKRLTAAGILRVALVAGSRDQSAARLARNARRLARANVDARYFELAGTGHFFDAQSEQRMVEPLRWLLEK